VAKIYSVQLYDVLLMYSAPFIGMVNHMRVQGSILSQGTERALW